MQCPICDREFSAMKMDEISLAGAEGGLITCQHCGTQVRPPWKKGLQEILRLAIKQENNILAIKCVRGLTDLNLRDAKDMVWAILDK